MIAYKLLTQRADGSLGPLFINKRQRVPIGEWLDAECHPTPGYALRPGWHCTMQPVAPHLSKRGRVWCMVEIDGVQKFTRPECQGGAWLLAKRMRVLSMVTEPTNEQLVQEDVHV
jgi:hypothetical protein